MLGQIDGGFGTQIPFVVAVKVADMGCHQGSIGKSGAIVFGGIACNINGSFDRILQGAFGEVGRTGAAFALADIDRNV